MITKFRPEFQLLTAEIQVENEVTAFERTSAEIQVGIEGTM